jgi:hypothetical protein
MIDTTRPIYEVSDVLDNTVFTSNDLEEARAYARRLGVGHSVWGPFPYEQRSPF